MKPDGVPAPQGTGKPVISVPEENPLRQGQAIRTFAFWILALGVFQLSMIGTGIILHFVSIFQQAGFSMTFAARVMSIRPVVGLATSLVLGLTLDKVRTPKFVLATASFGQVAGILVLAFMRSAGTAVGYSVIAGVSGTTAVYCIGFLIPRLFGRTYIGGILGVTTAISVVGSALGPVFFAAAFDLFGGYREVILVSAVLPSVSGVLSFMIQNRRNSTVTSSARSAE